MIRYQSVLTSAALLCVLGAGMSGLASAQPMPTPRGPVPFGTMDRNDDGTITPQEFNQHKEQRQAARAAQGRFLRHAGQEPKFEDWDRDANGVLTPRELAQGQQERFAARRPGWTPGSGPGWGPAYGPDWDPAYGRGMGPGWGPDWGPSYGPGWGQGWGPGAYSGRPCWRNQ